MSPLNMYRERFLKAAKHLDRCFEENPSGLQKLECWIDEALTVGGLDVDYAPNWEALRLYAQVCYK